ncbi:MAG: hypothetical protein AB8G18_02350 [Gammaproteobacteria bacterium]
MTFSKVASALVLGFVTFFSLASNAESLAISSAGSPDTASARQQNISIGIFNPGIPSDTSLHRQLGVFPEVRGVEARLLPFVLREILMESDQWGAVRVVPSVSPGDEILVSGLIKKSDGETLEVQMSAVDAFGREWVNGLYSMESGTNDPNNPVEISTSFKNVFIRFSNDLLAARDTYSELQLGRNREVALLRYASKLLPDFYSQHIQSNAEGLFEIARLPASDDPMLERIRRIREFEYLFIDQIDEQYQSLYLEVSQTYNLWLRYQERLTRYRLEGEQQRRNSVKGSRGSFNAMRESYEHYKWLKMEEQNLRKWALGFSNEVDPTVVEVEGRVVRLDGSLEQRYDEWSEILRSILRAESEANN